MNFFITNREIINNNGLELIREDGKENAGDNLRFGFYHQAEKSFELFPEPDNYADLLYSDISAKSPNELKGSAKFFASVYNAAREKLVEHTPTGYEKGDILFFIHGFNTDLNSVRESFETLNKKYVDNPNTPIKHILIFTWPSRRPDLPFHYFDDKQDAIRSGKVLARLIHDKVIPFFKQFLVNEKNEPCERNFHLMCHSMGSRVLKHLMLELKQKEHFKPELFKEILLLASDVEYDIFENNEAFDSLLDMGERIHIYYHVRDRVLDISKYTKNLSSRLGRYGRKSIDLGLMDVFDANVSDTVDDEEYGFKLDKLNHWYYFSSTAVVEDIVSVLNGHPSKFTIKG